MFTTPNLGRNYGPILQRGRQPQTRAILNRRHWAVRRGIVGFWLFNRTYGTLAPNLVTGEKSVQTGTLFTGVVKAGAAVDFSQGATTHGAGNYLQIHPSKLLASQTNSCVLA